MSKEKFVVPTQEDTRLRTRIRRGLRRLFHSRNATPSNDSLPNRWLAGGVAWIASAVFAFSVLINFLPKFFPGIGFSYTQLALISLGVGLLPALWVFLYITHSKTVLKRGFLAAAFMTLFAIVGYSFKVTADSGTGKPVSVVAEATPLQGWSIVAAIAVVTLLFFAMINESKSS